MVGLSPDKIRALVKNRKIIRQLATIVTFIARPTVRRKD
jgi:hypothetical protein